MVGHQTQEEANSQGNQQDPQHLVFQSCFEGLLSHNPLSRASRLDASPCGGQESRLCNRVYISRKPQPCACPVLTGGGELHFTEEMD